ncbi:thiamine pyrophosphate-binding protein [Geothrix sp. 21YS21S-2]|uniref:thiamine pyrophosphate-binding protein n=1 Tax=Geothrix sp. 21YS21S-2 TaxID=3068893 RepID=UPI0027B9B379|nr:thiamine pyrophosphate-binding protein [Geothrix sp. 21YS21S-2]
MMKLSSYVASFLAAHGARHIFAISGAGNVHLLEGVDDHPDLTYVCPHHEQAGVMAAIAYHRLSDRMGVMMTTGGPGAVNAISGVLDAWADSFPCLIISGQEKSAWAREDNPLRMWGVQGTNIAKMVSGITKYSAMITDPSTIRWHLEKAWHLASSGRPGPVWLDIPTDIQAAQVDENLLEGYARPVAEAVDFGPHMARVRELIGNAKRPVLWLGHGIRLAGALGKLDAFLDHLPFPFLTSWNGADMVPSSHPRHFGHAGVYGQRCGNFVLQNSDLVIAIGTRLAIPQVGYEWSEFARGAQVAVVDIDGTELGKLPESDRFLKIHADAGQFLDAIRESIPAQPEPASWLAQCCDWEGRYPLVEPELHVQSTGRLNSYRFAQALVEELAEDDVVVTDMGAALTTTHQAITLKAGQRLVTSTGLGEMGFGLPGAIGAAFGKGGRVILLAGDGSTMMNVQELQTIFHHQLPIKIFLYANDGYLTIRQTQRALFGEHLVASGSASGVTCPDFAKVAEAFGIPSLRLSDPAEVSAMIARTLATPGPVLCQVSLDPEQILGPKLSLAVRPDGTLVSPPLEDLAPFLPRAVLRKEMLVGLHPKSQALD